jgi:hypothetical protein
MPTYAAFLGHQPLVSLAELSAAFDGLGRVHKYGTTAVTFMTDAPVTPAVFSTLGGTILLARGIADGPIDLEDVPTLLINEANGIRGKLTFALRGHGLSPKALRECYRACKDRLKSAGRPSRYVGNERHAAAAALLKDAGIADGSHGVEIVLLQEEETLWVGRTIAVQDPDAYTLRDMEKPVRDTTVGLLPPKLAQVLLTFGGWMVRSGKKDLPKDMTVFDPFCGTGVIPMECALKRWNALASDQGLKAVNGCTKNVEWLRKRFSIAKGAVTTDVFKHDARKPFPMAAKPTKDQYRMPHVVVTETSLGPNLKERATLKDAQTLRRDNEKLQEEFLRTAAASLPGVPLVVTWPVWYLRTGPIFLEKIWDVARECGYTPVLPPDTEPHISGRKALLYRRPDQFVGREIVMLKAQS